MAFKFRRTMKIAPGLKINLTHRGAGVRVGPKGAGYSVNTSGKQTVSGGIPGSGVHVSKTISSGKSTRQARQSGGGWLGRLVLVAAGFFGLVIIVNLIN